MHAVHHSGGKHLWRFPSVRLDPWLLNFPHLVMPFIDLDQLRYRPVTALSSSIERHSSSQLQKPIRIICTANLFSTDQVLIIMQVLPVLRMT